jgi:hypothetical protein
MKLEDYITLAHIESMNKVILLTGTIVGIAYLTELFIAWYSGYQYEQTNLLPEHLVALLCGLIG